MQLKQFSRLGPELIPSDSDDDAVRRLAWRQSLPEWLVRSLASDYLRGQVDECNHDAYLEYEHRYGSHRAKHSEKGRRARGAGNTRYA